MGNFKKMFWRWKRSTHREPGREEGGRLHGKKDSEVAWVDSEVAWVDNEVAWVDSEVPWVDSGTQQGALTLGFGKRSVTCSYALSNKQNVSHTDHWALMKTSGTLLL